MKIRQQLSRLLALGRSRRLDRELDDEMQAHLELAERDARARGLSPDDARRDARLRLGGMTAIREDHRDVRSASGLDTWLRDARYGLAALARDRGFAAVAVGVLALGIGANTAMFGVVNAVLLAPLPFPEPDRIVWVWETPEPGQTNATTTGGFLEWQRQSVSFEALAAVDEITATTTIAGEPERLTGRVVTASYFDVFGTIAALGRTFAAGDDVPGAAPVIVISHRLWQTRFGGAAGIVGQKLTLDAVAHRIVGVLPAGTFDRDATRPGEEVAVFWKPLIFTSEQMAAGSHWLNVAGRLRAGVTIAQANDDMLRVRARLAAAMPAYKKDWSVVVEPFDARLVADTLRQSIWVTLGAVTMVLLIACANIANLLLARGAARRKEMAVRAALGASRGRLVRQLLTESFVLCSVSGAAGVALAALLVRIAVPLLPLSVPFTAEVAIDLRVLAFAMTVSLGVAMIVGLIPAWQATSTAPAAGLNVASRGSSSVHHRVRRTIVIVEVALSLVLLSGALLLFRSLINLQRVDLGVRVDRILTMSIDLSAARYPSPEHAAAFYRELTARLARVPGVERVSAAQDLPLEGAGGENIDVPGEDGRVLVSYKRVDSGYFETLEIPVLRGRGITESDRLGAARVVVINEQLAARLAERFKITDPIGRTIRLAVPRFNTQGATREAMTIVGVIRNERINRDLRAHIADVTYVPIAQVPRLDIKVLARVADDAAVVPLLRAGLREIDPRLALAHVRTLTQVRAERSLSAAMTPAWLVGTFAAVAALLAALGLYGVLAHGVAQQRREIGIRMAMGASHGDVIRGVLRSATVMVMAGLAMGLAGATALTRVLATLLFGISPLDPFTLMVACAAMATIALAAAAIPAARAVRVNPAMVLRAD